MRFFLDMKPAVDGVEGEDGRAGALYLIGSTRTAHFAPEQDLAGVTLAGRYL